jgi:UDP-glucose 4-epimerase
MRVLVTGGGGFIGRAVARELEAVGVEPVIFDRPHDVRDGLDVATAGIGCDAVIHMAGVLGTHELFDTPELAIDVNIKGTLNVLEWCRNNDTSFVGITMPQVFPSIYTATKVASTRLASAYHLTHGVPVSHVRAFNAFGPGQAHGPGHPQKIIPTFAYNAWRGIPIPIWGDGQQTVDLIHTTDLARLLVGALAYGDDDVFDGGTGEAMTVEGVVQLVRQIVVMNGGPDTPVEHLPMRRGEVPTNIVARGEGWNKLYKPHFRIRDLEDTVLSYKP